MARVNMHITTETRNRGDCWTCHVPEFGFTVYGESRDAARHEVNNALDALLGSFYGDLEAIEQFLNQRNVRYVIHPDAEPDYQTPIAEMSHAEVRIAAAV